MWTIVFLAMGGIALGKGVTSSGLLNVMDGVIRDLVDGYSLYNVVLILSPVVLVRPFSRVTLRHSSSSVSTMAPVLHCVVSSIITDFNSDS